jgi:hypothetical protein
LPSIKLDAYDIESGSIPDFTSNSCSSSFFSSSFFYGLINFYELIDPDNDLLYSDFNIESTDFCFFKDPIDLVRLDARADIVFILSLARGFFYPLKLMLEPVLWLTANFAESGELVLTLFAFAFSDTSPLSFLLFSSSISSNLNSLLIIGIII